MKTSKMDMRHEGIVKSVEADVLTVDIPVSSACAHCHAKSVCGSGTADVRTVRIVRKNDGIYRPGDRVTVSITRDMGFRAVFLAYVYPFAILFVLLLTLPLLMQNELYVGLVCIGVLALYYVVLALFRKRIDSGFKFNIVAKI